MAQAVGYAILPVSASLSGITEELRSQLVGPTEKAAKQAGDAIKRSLSDGVDKATRDTEKAQWRVKKSTEELTTAESKLAEQKLKSEAANLAVEAAAKKREQAESKGVDAVAKAEQELLKKRAAAERESRNLAAAEQGVEKALTESARAAENLEEKQKSLADATEGAGQATQGLSEDLKHASADMDDVAEKSSTLGDKITSGLGTIGKGALLGVGAKIGTTIVGGVGTAFSKGFGRLQSLENAEASLKGLGRSAEDIELIMGSVSQAVKGTAFGLDEAAQSAATFSTLGVKSGEDMDRVMTLLADTTAQAGTDLSEISPIMQKVVAAGGLSMDTFDQLNERATGVGEALSKELGVPIEEVRDLASTVDFDTFARAMENNIGGAAKKSGETFGNAFGNMQAALGRLGEKFLAPAFALGPEIFGAIGGAFDKLGETIEPVLADLTEKLQPHMEEFAAKLGPWLVETIEQVANAIKNTVGWIRENAELLKTLAVGIGTAVGAWKLFTTGMKIHAAAVVIADKGWKGYIASTKIATAVTKLFNKATKANIIGLIATALIAVGGALVYFFTKTETGREMWAKFTDFLKNAWESVSEKFGSVVESISNWWNGLTGDLSAGWESIKSGVFDAWNSTVEGVKSGWESVTGALSSAWETTKELFVGAWNAIKDLVFLAFTSYINLIKFEWDIVTSALTFAWNFLKDSFISAWNLIRDGVFIAWDNAVNNLKAVWDIVTTAVTTAWSVLKDLLVSVWNTIRDAVFTAFSVAAEVLRSSFETVTNALGSAWDWVKDKLNAGYEFIRDTVFGGLKTALDTVKSAFEVARDAIGVAWDGIKAKAAAPVKFVIERVFNDGIVEAWNKVADWVDLPTISKYQPDWLGQFAQGTSRVPGARTPYDNVHMVSTDGRFGISLRGGEGVVVPEVVDALGPDKIDGMNAAARMGGAQGVLRYLGGFAGGGVIGSISSLVNRFYPGMSITSTLRPGDPGHHGTGNAVDFSNGFDSTPEMRSAAQFFYKNYGPALLELIHSPFSNNVKNGQNVGDGFGLYGAGTMNAHRNHVHVAAAGALPEPGDPITPVPSGGGGGGVINWLRNRVADVLDGVFGPIGNMIPSFGGLIGDMPKAAFSKMTGAVSDFIRGKAEESGAYFGDVGAGVEQWRPLVVSILKAKGLPESLADTTLRRMDQESGGNSRAINNWDSNAAAGIPSKGLMQVIDPTFAAHKDPGFDDIWDPEANIRASMNYALAQYGSLPAAYNRAGGYHEGGLAGYGRGLLRKTALEPEMVLNPEMTKAFIQWMNVSPESMRMVAREISEAFHGGDFGSGELAGYVGRDLAQAAVDIAAVAGEVSRALAPIANSSGRSYLETQATSLLDVVGLGGLVPFASDMADKHGPALMQSAQDMFGGISVSGSLGPGGATVIIEAESDEDLVRVGQLKALADHVHGLDVQVNAKKRPPAAAVTRGGVM